MEIALLVSIIVIGRFPRCVNCCVITNVDSAGAAKRAGFPPPRSLTYYRWGGHALARENRFPGLNWGKSLLVIAVWKCWISSARWLKREKWLGKRSNLGQIELFTIVLVLISFNKDIFLYRPASFNFQVPCMKDLRQYYIRLKLEVESKWQKGCYKALPQCLAVFISLAGWRTSIEIHW